jgi:hypothetical protein
MRHWRWAVVLTGVATLVAMPAAIASIDPENPDVDLSTLRTRVLESAAEPFEGLFESRGGARLPDLGRFEDQLKPFTETTRVRVWYTAPDRWRADDVTIGGERGFYRDPTGIWRWSTGSREAVFVARTGEEPLRLPRIMDLSPTELGRRLLKESANETVEMIDARRVAGTVGAGIRITPTAASTSSITSVEMWADPETGVVLRVEIFTGSSLPIFETGYLELEIKEPNPDVLTFDPDEADDVEYEQRDSLDPVEQLVDAAFIPLPDELAGLPPRHAVSPAVKSYGSGLTVVSLVAAPRSALGRRLAFLPRSERPWGGSVILLEASLVNAEVIEIGGLSYILIGTVTVAELDRIAAELVATGGTS